MSGTTWSKFFWSDWQADPALRNCSYAARGLWMDMLCIAAAHDPIGYVSVAGRGLDETAIARMTGGLESEARALLGELEQNGVFSRDRKGTIYSRRMTTDARKSAIARKNGKDGGNPTLSNTKGNSSSDKGQDKPPLKPQEPEARSQKPEEFSLRSNERARDFPDWWPFDAWEGFVEMRKKAKKPLTDRAMKLMVSKVSKLKADGEDPAALFDQSTLKNWMDVFPVKPQQFNGTGHAASSPPISLADEQRKDVKLFKDRGIWLSTKGPPPTDPDCSYPASILCEFGFREPPQHQDGAT